MAVTLFKKKLISPESVYKVEKWISTGLIMIALIMTIIKRLELSILILMGVWAAYSYSLPPFRLSYCPFLGGWLSLFQQFSF